MTEENKNTSSTTKMVILLLLCVGAAVGAWFFIDWFVDRPSPRNSKNFSAQYRVPLEQMVAISNAIDAYTREHDKRPESLDDLVTAGLIGREVLFDPARKSVPAAGPYDVIYNPAVLPDDSRDCVILYNIFVEHPDEPFYAVHNDYSISQFRPRELVEALNNTYRVVGEAIVKKYGPQEASSEAVRIK